jgi:hypothetical protein
MAKFHDLLTRIADEGVVALDGFPVDSWRAIRAMKEVGLLVREGGDKGGRWIVKKERKVGEPNINE